LSYGVPGYAVNYQVRLNAFLLVMQRTLQVRFGSQADICAATGHVRFTPNSDRKSEFPHPAGRPKDSRNKLGEAFLQDVYELWQTHGADALVRMCRSYPNEFVRVVAGLLPKEMHMKSKSALTKMSDEELDEAIATLGRRLGNVRKGKNRKTPTNDGAEPDSVH
jgi:hypothetical protein